MKAIAFDQYGPAEVLRYTEVPAPELKPGEILVRVRASGVNPADWRLRNGQFRRAFRLKLPFIPGSDVAGEVEATGGEATRFKKGDRVFAMLPLKAGGGYAEFAAVDQVAAAVIPEGGAWELYGATPLAGLTAWQGLVKHGECEKGQSVLINGGSGGVGSFAVQIARAMGAHVTATTSGRNADFVRSLGAAEVIDYTSEAVFRGPGRFDLVFDTIATQSFRKWSATLKRHGVVVTVNPIIGKVLPRLVTKMMGIDRLASFFVEPNANDLAQLAQRIASNQVKPQIESVFSLERAAEAQRLSELGHVRGKLVLLDR